jgi:hypothetical protein
LIASSNNFLYTLNSNFSETLTNSSESLKLMNIIHINFGLEKKCH